MPIDVREVILRIETLLEDSSLSVEEVCREYRRLGLAFDGHLSMAEIPADLEKQVRNHTQHRANLMGDPRVTDAVFEMWLHHVPQTPLTITHVRAKAQRARVGFRRDEMRAEENHLSGDSAELYVGDVRKILTLKIGGLADAIITDPPYPQEFIPLFGDLIRFADRTLRKHGWLVFMSGMAHLDDVFEQLNRACEETDMRYVWAMALHTPGAASPQWLPTSSNSKAVVNPQWKPIFVYSKGQNEPWPGTDGVTDFLVSGGVIDKALDEWNQDLNVFRKLVRMFSAPGNLVVDPFLGGGTTAVASLAEGRAVEGFDINEDDVRRSIGRLQS